MTKALLKNTFREIANTKARFISIMAIIALGVGFFAGIKATSPSMYNLAENYFSDRSLMDFRLVSTVGFSENDVKAVSELEGVSSVMPSYYCDVMTPAEDGGDVIRLIAVPNAYKDNKKLNSLVINDGDGELKSGEIITESVAFANGRHKLGSTVSFASAAGNQQVSDILKHTSFTVKGKAESPLYISYQRGKTTIGDGKIEEYMYIPAEDFKSVRYTELYVKGGYSDEVSAFSDDYEKGTDELKAKLEQLGKDRGFSYIEEMKESGAKLGGKGSDSATPEAAQWYVFTRDDNPGYHTFSQNADRLDAVASVFPLFFLLVAVLVCVTTMTRLIEEKRTEIATLKALGYGNISIIFKYVIYSIIAAVAGGIIGVVLGLFTLPFIIYDAYRIMFYIGDITLVPHVPSIALGLLAAIICTSAVSVIVCAKSLKTKPAQGMRPKAPKPGKRILLAHITPLWKHMGFTAKLTARNLFRYKVRLCMTVIGVAGCTALVLAAFGLLDSFEPLTKTQFDEIFKYDAIVIPKQSGSPEELGYVKKLCNDTGKVKSAMFALQEDVKLEANGSKTTESTYISVPETTENIDELITLRTRKGHTPLTLTDGGVMVNEKLASDFGISVGDKVKLTTGYGTAEIRVDGIYEQYIHNYILMTKDCYRSLFGRDVSYNLYQVLLTDKSEETADEFSSALMRDERISAVPFMRENIDEFRNMLNSLDMVVAVMIVCAAALAFVVLYNLTNINIAERQREIATFKVLGFFNRETSRFIYIENIILTILGIGAGLWLGVLLTNFIIRTVEVDNVMFGRDIFPQSFLFAAGLTLLFSLLVNLAMSFKIRRVNMVESLKSVE